MFYQAYLVSFILNHESVILAILLARTTSAFSPSFMKICASLYSSLLTFNKHYCSTPLFLNTSVDNLLHIAWNQKRLKCLNHKYYEKRQVSSHLYGFKFLINFYHCYFSSPCSILDLIFAHSLPSYMLSLPISSFCNSS